MITPCALAVRPEPGLEARFNARARYTTPEGIFANHRDLTLTAGLSESQGKGGCAAGRAQWLSTPGTRRPPTARRWLRSRRAESAGLATWRTSRWRRRGLLRREPILLRDRWQSPAWASPLAPELRLLLSHGAEWLYAP